jgi:NADH-quinone oxidoreductase subunit C
MKELIKKLSSKYELQEVTYQRDNLVFAAIDKKQAIDAVTYLRDYEGYTHLVMMSCADWIEDGKFQLLYLLNSPLQKNDIGIKVYIDRENPEMVSAHHLWKSIWTYQRELRESFGINFPGSPRIEENFVVEGWDDKPHMLRDFDTHEYAEKTYFPRGNRKTHDPAEYMRAKLYPNQPVTAKQRKDDK